MHKHTKKLVRFAKPLIKEGYSYRDIARKAKRAGICNRRGKMYSESSISLILRSAGIRKYGMRAAKPAPRIVKTATTAPAKQTTAPIMDNPWTVLNILVNSSAISDAQKVEFVKEIVSTASSVA